MRAPLPSGLFLHPPNKTRLHRCEVSRMVKPCRKGVRFFAKRSLKKQLEWVYVLGLRTLLPLRHSELYPLALFQGTEAR